MDSETMNQIEDQSAMVHEIAGILSRRIKAFEDRLNELKGRVATRLECGEFVLDFARNGKRWELSCMFNDERGPIALDQASLKVKIAACAKFEDLLDRMVISQRDLIEEIQKAIEQIDAIEEKIKCS